MGHGDAGSQHQLVVGRYVPFGHGTAGHDGPRPGQSLVMHLVGQLMPVELERVVGGGPEIPVAVLRPQMRHHEQLDEIEILPQPDAVPPGFIFIEHGPAVVVPGFLGPDPDAGFQHQAMRAGQHGIPVTEVHDTLIGVCTGCQPIGIGALFQDLRRIPVADFDPVGIDRLEPAAPVGGEHQHAALGAQLAVGPEAGRYAVPVFETVFVREEHPALVVEFGERFDIAGIFVLLVILIGDEGLVEALFSRLPAQVRPPACGGSPEFGFLHVHLVIVVVLDGNPHVFGMVPLEETLHIRGPGQFGRRISDPGSELVPEVAEGVAGRAVFFLDLHGAAVSGGQENAARPAALFLGDVLRCGGSCRQQEHFQESDDDEGLSHYCSGLAGRGSQRVDSP